MSIIDKYLATINNFVLTRTYYNPLIEANRETYNDKRVSIREEKVNNINFVNKDDEIDIDEKDNLAVSDPIAIYKEEVLKEKDNLFWVLYILSKKYDICDIPIGADKFETETQTKIEWTNLLQKAGKEMWKITKLKKCDIIPELGSSTSKKISRNVFIALCYILELNIVYVSNRCWIPIRGSNSEDDSYTVIFVNKGTSFVRDVKEECNQFAFKYVKSNSKKEIEFNSDNLFELENLSKPLRAISAYKVADLIDICNKLSIDIMNDKGKTCVKAELYRKIDTVMFKIE